MENKSPIPAEIRTFFGDEYGKTLLIKGEPGTGKTVFALTLLSMLKGNGAYLSTRVDPQTLYMLYPWVKGTINPDNIVDATQSEHERKKAKGAVTIKPLRYTAAPDFLKAIYTRAEKMKNPIILIVEYTEQRALDYMVDAVITTKSDMYEGRRLRSLSIQKLRGCSIKNPLYLFSLYNSIFTFFSAPETEGIENPVIPDSIPDITNGSISTGIKDLDMLIAGYAHLSVNIFEGDYLPYEILARALAINSLNLGRHVFLTSAKQYESINKILPFVKEEYRGNIESEEELKNLKERIKGVKGKFVLFLDLEKTEHIDEVVREVMSSIREQGHKQGCAVMCYTGREEVKGEELESIASTYFKTKFFSGIPCIYGEFPRTRIHAMELNTSEGFSVINLTPIE
jgi:Cdc6-like AAA superfamily ATPase